LNKNRQRTIAIIALLFSWLNCEADRLARTRSALSAHVPQLGNTRGLFIVVYGYSTSYECDSDASYIYRNQKQGESDQAKGKGTQSEEIERRKTTKEEREEKERREEKKIEQTPCSMLMTIHVKPQTVGKTRLNHSQETNS
jgi:hypothetical protein